MTTQDQTCAELVARVRALEPMEVWSFINRSSLTHPMHMHLVLFQVLDRQAFDEIGGQVVPELTVLLGSAFGVAMLGLLARRRLRRGSRTPWPYDACLVDVLKRIDTHPFSRVEELIPRCWKRHFADQSIPSRLS